MRKIGEELRKRELGNRVDIKKGQVEKRGKRKTKDHQPEVYLALH